MFITFIQMRKKVPYLTHQDHVSYIHFQYEKSLPAKQLFKSKIEILPLANDSSVLLAFSVVVELSDGSCWPN